MNKVPDKIYINPLLMEDGESIVRRCTFERQRDSQLEYTRTNILIERAKEFLLKESNIPLWEDMDGNYGCDTPKLVENFIKYLKGE